MMGAACKYGPDIVAGIVKLRTDGKLSFSKIDTELNLKPGTAYSLSRRLDPELRAHIGNYRRSYFKRTRVYTRDVPAVPIDDVRPRERAILERDARNAAAAHKTLTQQINGDPAPGFSALDRKRMGLPG